MFGERGGSGGGVVVVVVVLVGSWATVSLEAPPSLKVSTHFSSPCIDVDVAVVAAAAAVAVVVHMRKTTPIPKPTLPRPLKISTRR